MRVQTEAGVTGRLTASLANELPKLLAGADEDLCYEVNRRCNARLHT